MGVGSPGAGSWLAVATYSSNWPRLCGNRMSIVYTPIPPRNTHFSKGCQDRPSRGLEFLLSRADSPVFGWMKAPILPVRSSTTFGSKLVIEPYLLSKVLSFE